MDFMFLTKPIFYMKHQFSVSFYSNDFSCLSIPMASSARLFRVSSVCLCVHMYVSYLML